MAIGITVKEANLPVLADQLEKAAEQAQLDFRQRPQLNLDATVAISELSTDLVTKIKQLGPFGMDNPVPKLAITNVRVTDVKAIGQNQAHLKFTANQAGQQLATKKPQILIYNIIFDLIVGIFFVYYLKVSANLSTFLRVILMAFAAYDFTDMFFSIKLLLEQRRRNKHK
ncbi:hypothetical protein OGM84_10890 [Pediococcus acidilactici]